MSKSKKTPMISAMCLYTNKDKRPVKIPHDTDINKFDYNKLSSSIIKKSGSGAISRECDYTWNNSIISTFCWTDGNAGCENQHDLPPPIDTELYFGDIIAVKHNDGILQNLTLEEYDTFYSDAFGGFENLDSDESFSSDESVSSTDSINDFIVSDSEPIEEFSSSESEDEASSSSNESKIDELNESGNTNSHADGSSGSVGDTEELTT